MVPPTVRVLDANLLVALAWPQHAHHGRAIEWFRRVADAGWATCALTQLAFIRVSSNPRITSTNTTPRMAAELLRRLTALPGHRYLPETPPPIDLPQFAQPQLLGHGQVTDLYLLALAMHHGCRLATLDAGVPELLPTRAEREAWVEVVG